MPELPWLQTPRWQMTYSHLLLSRQKCMDSTRAPELDWAIPIKTCWFVGLFFFLISQPIISESRIYTRPRQNRAKLHQLFLPSSCFSDRIPITYRFLRAILLEVNSSRRTWVRPNSKASTLPLHSTIFCTSAQFRSELISTKAAWYLIQGLPSYCNHCVWGGSQSLPSVARLLPGWALSWDLIYSCLTNIEDLVLTKVCSADSRSAWHSELSTEVYSLKGHHRAIHTAKFQVLCPASADKGQRFSNHVFHTWQQNF